MTKAAELSERMQRLAADMREVFALDDERFVREIARRLARSPHKPRSAYGLLRAAFDADAIEQVTEVLAYRMAPTLEAAELEIVAGPGRLMDLINERPLGGSQTDQPTRRGQDLDADADANRPDPELFVEWVS